MVGPLCIKNIPPYNEMSAKIIGNRLYRPGFCLRISAGNGIRERLS